MEKPSQIKLEHVSHKFGVTPVLKDVTISFRENEITAILGKSGSGKSTILQLINGMLKPSAGSVKLFADFLDYKNIAATRLRLGYVIQQVGLFPHMTIRENVSLPGKITNKPKEEIEDRIKHLMQMVQLPLSHLSKYPYQLSGGEQQRAGLCRAMLLNPPVMLMDEPFAALDYSTKHNIYDYMLAMQKTEPRSIIFVTHDWDEAMILADNFIWIEEGHVRASGSKSELSKMKESYLSKT